MSRIQPFLKKQKTAPFIPCCDNVFLLNLAIGDLGYFSYKFFRIYTSFLANFSRLGNLVGKKLLNFVQIVMSNDIDLPVRQAAVIYLKNMVSDTDETNDLIYLFFGNLSTPFVRIAAKAIRSLTEDL